MRGVALIAVIGAAGCEKKFNEEYCTKHGDDPAYAMYCHADGSIPIDTIIPDGPPGTYRIIGAVDGLTSGTLVLQNNGGDDLSVTMNGAFFFQTTLTTGSHYDVTVKTQPDPLTCTVDAGSGTVGSQDVSDIAVHCIGDPGIACGATFCATNSYCCIDTATPVCGGTCTKTLHCDDTADCNGTGICCGLVNNGGQVLGSVCKSDVSACMATNANDEVLCDPTPSANDTVCGGMMCLSSNRFTGYHSCQ